MSSLDPTKAERTRERILVAATREFAAYGVAGARVDRIARESKANKSLIYGYFESKEKLFRTVLETQLAAVYDAVDFTSDDLPGYAAGLFDFAMDHPHLMRLVMWNGLELRPEWPLAEASSIETQLRSIRASQSDGLLSQHFPAEFVLTLILTMASAWTAANPFGLSIMPDAAGKRDTLRAALRETVALFAGTVTGCN